MSLGLPQHAAKVMKLAKAAEVTLATVESCTAGALAVLLADAPEAGKRFHGGFVVYTKENKTAALGVSPALIAAQSAVSSDVAKAMAAGALDRCPADISVAITGVAGPEPDEDGNPVGLVYVAVAAKRGLVKAIECKFGKVSREGIRDRSMAAALTLLETVLSEQVDLTGHP